MQMKPQTNRNGTVDFFRFVFCFVILLRHSEYALPSGTFDFLKRGALCVEFFFLVSGYLMARSAQRRLEAPKLGSTGMETAGFLRRKIATLLPTLPVAVLISFVVTEISKQTAGVGNWFKAFTEMIWDLLMLPGAGYGNTSERWYISCMLLVILVFFPVIIKHFDLFVRVIAPLIAVFTLGWIYKNYKELINPHLYLGHMYKGLLRAFGEIALGVALYPLIEWFKTLRFTRPVKLLVSFTELACAAASIFMMATVKGKDYDFFILLLIIPVVVLAFSHQGYFADRMDHPFNYLLGRVSFAMYLSNVWISQAMGRYYKRFVEAGLYGLGADIQADKIKILCIYTAISLGMTLIVYTLSLALKKLGTRMDAAMKKKYAPTEAA